MAFVPKVWQNSPSTATPINAEALIDLEQRVTGYALPALAVHATATSNETLVADKITPVNATGGAISMTLPSGEPLGSLIAVEKTDSSKNAVTLTGSIRGSAGSVTLTLENEILILEAESSGSWRPIASHRPRASLETIFVLGGAASGEPGQRRVALLKAGGNAWVDDVGLPIEAFGAKWDGVTDDTTPIEEAIKASEKLGGMPVLLPHGTGLVNGSPRVPKNLGSIVIPIRGQGMYATTVKMTTGFTFLKFANVSPTDTVGNIDISDFTVDGQSLQMEENKSVPVVCGTDISTNNQVNIKNIRVRRVRTINIPKKNTEAGGRRCIILGSNHPEPGLTQSVIENIDIRECLFEGGQYAVFVGATSGAKAPLNVKLSNIYIGDCRHVSTEVPTNKEGFECNFQVGQYGFSDGASIILERLYGENSGDVGIEVDVPCIINDCWIRNANNAAYLFNTFNAATINAPVVAKITETAAAGSTTITVTNHTGFSEGEKVVIYGANVNTSEVRVIESFPDATHIKFTEATGLEWKENTWIQQVDDMQAAWWRGRNLTAVRTATFLGSNHGLTVQNSENVIPCPSIDIDGYTYLRTAADTPESQGEILNANPGTANSPTGNPNLLRIRRLRARIKNLTYTGTATKSYWPMYIVMRGSSCPIEIQGDVLVEGPGATSTGKYPGQIVHIGSTQGILDIDLLTQWKIKNSNGEPWRGICVNQESTVGDISGRIRHRTRKSEIAEGGGIPGGIRFGKACGFASKNVATKLKGGELAAKSTTIPVTSTEGFAVGQAIVIDALSTTLSEIFVVEKVNAGESLVIVKQGKEPGTVAAHKEPCVVAVLKDLIIEDCDWFGLGTTGNALIFEDENLASRIRTRGNIYPTPPTPQEIKIESTVALQINQKGQSGIISMQEGTTTQIEWSPDGKNFFKVGTTTTNGVVFPISSGDFIKVTFSVEPKVKFIPSRNQI